MSLIGLLQGNPGGLPSATHSSALSGPPLQTTDPNVFRAYLSTAKTGNPAFDTSLAQQLSSNKAGISYQEIAGALGLTGPQGGAAPATSIPSTGYSAPAAPTGPSAADASYWQTQLGLIGDQINRLPNQGAIGEQNILDSYNAAHNTLLNGQSAATRDYNTSKDQTTQDNIVAKNNIDTGVRTQLTGIQRLLGSVGAGNSSAASIAAPYAAGVLGNQQRAGVQTAYGRNINALDTNFGDTTNQFNTAIGGLDADKVNRERALQAGMDSTHAQLLGEQNLINTRLGGFADPAVASEIKALGGQVDQLGAQQTFNPATVSYKTPTLADYSYGAAPAPALSGPNPNLTQNLGAYYTLLGQDPTKQKQNSILQPTIAPAGA